MMKKTITAVCAVMLALASVSCQKKSAPERYLAIQDEMIEIMGKIKDPASADKYAGKLFKLRKEAAELHKSMSDEEKHQTLTMNDQEFFKQLMYRKEPLKQALWNANFYGSNELKQALSDDTLNDAFTAPPLH